MKPKTPFRRRCASSGLTEPVACWQPSLTDQYTAAAVQSPSGSSSSKVNPGNTLPTCRTSPESLDSRYRLCIHLGDDPMPRGSITDFLRKISLSPLSLPDSPV